MPCPGVKRLVSCVPDCRIQRVRAIPFDVKVRLWGLCEMHRPVAPAFRSSKFRPPATRPARKNLALRYSLTSSHGPGSALIKLYSFSIKLAISMAAAAASAPLLPAFVPARSIACSIVSVVMTPKMIGTPVSSEELTVPLVVPEHT